LRVLIVLGLLTLVVARMAAIEENDGKKIVALSTLRQLGLMVLRLNLGGYFVCLFHLLIHAFAKANLFLIVGNIIHGRFSRQDIRQISSGSELFIMIITVFIRIASLRGVLFSSGFFSKEAVILRHYSLVNRLLVFFVLLNIVTLTLAYCFKISILIFRTSGSQIIRITERELIRVLPRNILTILSI
jgi:NADH:ubiquinone oxidoreductase subunit 5 (subunit L)/multisubunit Na+/H+ antiporter MnhA subunit